MFHLVLCSRCSSLAVNQSLESFRMTCTDVVQVAATISGLRLFDILVICDGDENGDPMDTERMVGDIAEEVSH